MRVTLAVSVVFIVQGLVDTKVDVNLLILRGELGGFSKLRCSLSQQGEQIELIQWKSGTNKEVVYFDSATQSPKTRKRGRFKQRNVTAEFIHNFTSHDLNIYDSVLEDETYYGCEVRLKSLAKHGASAFFNLTVQPKNRGRIRTAQGEDVGSSNCSKVPEVTVTDKISLICDVGASRPPPDVEWKNITNVTPYKETKSHRKYGAALVSVSQTLIAFPLKRGKALLICTVRVPNPSTGLLTEHEVCVHLIGADGHKFFIWVIMAAGVVVILVLTVVSAVVTYKKRRDTSDQRKQRQEEIEMERLLPASNNKEHETSSNLPGRRRKLKDGIQLDLSFKSLDKCPSGIFSRDIKKYVVELNLSHNDLHRLPMIPKCARLKQLYLQFCKLTSIEVESSNVVLEEINLEGNQLSSIPKNLLQIKNLKILKVSGNPLKLPRAITHMGLHELKIYVQVSEGHSETTPGFVIPVIGNVRAGKASFVEALHKHLEAHDSKELTGATEGPSANALHNKKPTFLNFPSTELYKTVYFHFLRDYGIIILCVNGKDYEESDHESHITYWLETICDRTRGNKILIFLTHSDLFAEQKDIFDKKRDALIKIVEEWQDNKRAIIQGRRDDLEKELRQQDCSERQEKQRKYEKLLNLLENFPILPESVCTFSKTSLNEIKNAFEKIESCRKDFAQEKIPAAWIDTHTALQDHYREDLCVSFRQFKAIMEAKLDMGSIDDNELKVALQCLNSYTYIFLPNPESGVKDTIYHNPQTIFAVLQLVFNSQNCHSAIDVDKTMTLEQSPFEKTYLAARIMNKHLPQDVVKGQEDHNHLNALLQYLGVSPQSENQEQEEGYKFPCVSSDMPNDDVQSGTSKCTRCLIVLCTPKCPLECFQALAVKLCSVSHKFRLWRNGISGYTEGEQLLKVRHDESEKYIKIYVEGEKPATVWRETLHIHGEIQDFLDRWSGITTEVVVPCPECLRDRNKNVTFFSGEYLTKPYHQQRRIRCLNHDDVRIIEQIQVYPPVEVLNQVSEQGIEHQHHELYVRLSMLITSYGPEMLREILQAKIQPMKLDKWLSKEVDDRRLKKEFVTELNQRVPWTPTETIQMADLNFDALFQIFTSCNIKTHPQISQVARTEEPNAADPSIQSLQELRNEIFANPHDAIREDKFREIWNQAEPVILALGGDEKRMDQILNSPIQELFTGRQQL